MRIFMTFVSFLLILLTSIQVRMAETTKSRDIYLTILIISSIWFGGMITLLEW